MMDGVHYMMDRVHHMMDGVHHMMDGVHHMMDTFFRQICYISLVFNSPRIKEFEFNGCCEIVFSISHSIAELFMLFSFG